MSSITYDSPQSLDQLSTTLENLGYDAPKISSGLPDYWKDDNANISGISCSATVS